MKNILKIEELFMFFFATYLISYFNLNYLLYILFFFAPDIGIAGYFFGPKIGAYTYNFLHHKGIALIILIFGLVFKNEISLFIGILLFGHASFDRVAGYGLKYLDDFKNTHLGYLGNKNNKK